MSLFVDIDKQFKDFSIHISFQSDSRTTGLLGASGGGKSLTLKCIAGIETPDRGRIVHNDRIFFDSEQGINLLPKERNVGYMFQNYALFPNMTVKQNIEIAVQDKNRKQEIAVKMMNLFHIIELKNRYPKQLSGGEQQRVALARILAYEPEILMLDEPFSAMDSYLRELLQQELKEQLSNYQGNILMVSHSRDELYRFCDIIAVVGKGRILRVADKTDVFNQPLDVTAARLTGCRNISRAKRISKNQVYAIDWDLILLVDAPVEQQVCYVGIRAHNIKPCENISGENVMEVGIAGIEEGPFENRIALYHKHQPLAGKLTWIVPKQVWKREYRGKCPEYVTFPKEHIYLLEDSVNCAKI